MSSWRDLLPASAIQELRAAAPEEDAIEADDGDFMMYEFKVRRCPLALAGAHEWTSCPYAHPGEAARRRDPRRFRYSGTPCPDSRRGPAGCCPRGAACPFAHGTFEIWLHPARFRTRPCRAGVRCARPVCFFAHTDRELRLPEEHAVPALSPRSVLAARESPPLSPVETRPLPPTKLADLNNDMEMGNLMIAMQGLNMNKAIHDSRVPEDSAPELGWVSDLVK